MNRECLTCGAWGPDLADEHAVASTPHHAGLQVGGRPIICSRPEVVEQEEARRRGYTKIDDTPREVVTTRSFEDVVLVFPTPTAWEAVRVRLLRVTDSRRGAAVRTDLAFVASGQRVWRRESGALPFAVLEADVQRVQEVLRLHPVARNQSPRKAWRDVANALEAWLQQGNAIPARALLWHWPGRASAVPGRGTHWLDGLDFASLSVDAQEVVLRRAVGAVASWAPSPRLVGDVVAAVRVALRERGPERGRGLKAALARLDETSQRAALRLIDPAAPVATEAAGPPASASEAAPASPSASSRSAMRAAPYPPIVGAGWQRAVALRKTSVEDLDTRIERAQDPHYGPRDLGDAYAIDHVGRGDVDKSTRADRRAARERWDKAAFSPAQLAEMTRKYVEALKAVRARLLEVTEADRWLNESLALRSRVTAADETFGSGAYPALSRPRAGQAAPPPPSAPCPQGLPAKSLFVEAARARLTDPSAPGGNLMVSFDQSPFSALEELRSVLPRGATGPGINFDRLIFRGGRLAPLDELRWWLVEGRDVVQKSGVGWTVPKSYLGDENDEPILHDPKRGALLRVLRRQPSGLVEFRHVTVLDPTYRSPADQAFDAFGVLDATGGGVDLREGDMLFRVRDWQRAQEQWRPYYVLTTQLRRGPVEVDDVRQDLVEAVAAMERTPCQDVELARAAFAVEQATAVYRELLKEWDDLHDAPDDLRRRIRVARAVGRRALDEAEACGQGQRSLLGVDEDLADVPSDASELAPRPGRRVWGRVEYDELDDHLLLSEKNLSGSWRQKTPEAAQKRRAKTKGAKGRA